MKSIFAKLIFPLIVLAWLAGSLAADEKVTFDDHVKPIFRRRCAACHGPKRSEGGLNLINFNKLMQGGSSGSSIEPGDAAGSYLFSLVTHDDSPEMPPDSDKIPDGEIRTIEAWINGGALENSGSVAVKKNVNLATSSTAIGVRPEKVAFPLRRSLEPYFTSQKPGVVRTIATSPWAGIAALAGPKQILLYRTDNLDFLGGLPFPEGQAESIRFSRDGGLLIAGGGRHGLAGKVAVFDVTSGDRLFDIGDELDNVLATDMHPDRSLVALGGPQKMVRVYATDTGAQAYEIAKHATWITAIQFSPDGVLMATADRNGRLHVWEAATGQEYLSLGGHDAMITGLSWRPDGNALASCGANGKIRIWEIENGKQIRAWQAHKDGVTAIEFSRDGKLVSCGRDSLVTLWQASGKPVRRFKGMADIGVAVGVCDEAGRIVASDLSGQLYAWSSNDGKLLRHGSTNPQPLAVRLEQAKQQLIRDRAELEPVLKELTVVQASLGKLREDQQQQRSLSGFAQKIEKLKKQRTANQKFIDSSVQKHKALKTKLQSRQGLLTKLAASASAAAAASEAAADDEALKAAAEMIAGKHQVVLVEVTELEKKLEELIQTTKRKTIAVSSAADQIKSFENRIASIKKRTKTLTARQPLVDRKNELKAKSNRLGKSVKWLESQVIKWQQEIEFASELKKQLEAVETAEQKLQSLNIESNAVKDQLKAVQADYDTRMDAQAEAKKAVEALRQNLRELQRSN